MQLNAETTQARAIKPSAPPPFYERPMLLRPGLNVRSGLTGPKGYEFARGVVAVPIGVSEFPLAARHYPIMFTAAELAPVVVLGVKGSRNLFVEPDGSWRAGHYVPGYIRRYPFTLTTIPDCVEQMLAIDTASDRFVQNVDQAEDASRFFDDEGRPTDTALTAMQVCQAYRDDCQRAEAFAKALRKAELLVPRQASMAWGSGSGGALDGLLDIDERVFRTLPISTVAQWHGDCWLVLIALTLASAHNWQALADRRGRCGPANPRAPEKIKSRSR